MIKIKFNNEKTYGFKREELEGKLLESGIEKINQADFGTFKPIIKSSLGSVFMMLGIQKPKEFKDMDNLEYAVRIAVNGLLNTLEGKTIDIQAEEIKEGEE